MNNSNTKHDVRSIRFHVSSVLEARRVAEGTKKTYGGRSQKYRDAREFARMEERRLLDITLQVFSTPDMQPTPIGAEG